MKKLKALSICSGIEAASVAWDGLPIEVVALSEIDAFPSAVLSHRFPGVPNLGDFTKITYEKIQEITGGTGVDVLIGGTPCQSFSIAGPREGLSSENGNLALEYLRLIDRIGPRWVIWENVPGALSSNGGRDFGTFLAGLGQCGYGWAYRILDANYFGSPCQRRRIFVVGFFGGSGMSASAVLFEPESGVRYFKKKKNAACCITKNSHKSYDDNTLVILEDDGPRIITPKEAGRILGFPDNWTKIPWKGKPAEQCPDGHQYKCYGNSMAVPVVKWIGERILTVEKNAK